MAKKSKGAEEIADDNERTNSMGLFNTAHSYWKSATTLAKAKVKVTHPDDPIRFLYYHAVELYLKALLRQEYGVEELRSIFGHKISSLVDAAEQCGLFVMDEDREVFTMMTETDTVIEARYIRTGPKTWPTLEALERTCKSVHESVGEYLRKRGVTVRR
jgi:hypothetical protein